MRVRAVFFVMPAEAGIQSTRYRSFWIPAPQLAKQLQADCLVAIGGGSPIDCAKALAVLATHGGNLREFENEDKVTGDVLPLIAIPTTAGPGREVTFSPVITLLAILMWLRFIASQKHWAVNMMPRMVSAMPSFFRQ